MSRNSNHYDPPPTKTPVKAELQVLRLSDDSKVIVMETLKSIHGNNFQLGNIAKYKDKGSHIKSKYWQERGNLVIQGGCDYSNIAQTGSTTEDRFRMFAIMKLESYGFYKSHCIEALDSCTGDIDLSLELLNSKYFPPSKDFKKPEIEFTDKELQEMREDECSALNSIYSNIFEEKEKNKVWQLRFKVDHLLVHSPSEKRKMEAAVEAKEKEKRLLMNKSKKKVEKCRNFLRGKCKYGNNCHFSHEVENKIKNSTEKSDDPNLDPNWFYLEIRFPKGNLYPYEPPLVFLKTTCPDISHMICLRLNRRLLIEARELAIDGMPSVYTISELLQMDDEISKFLNFDRHQFLDPKKSLFHIPTEEELEEEIDFKDRPTHYKKGAGRSERTGFNSVQVQKEDNKIMDKFLEKQTNPNYKNMLKSRKGLPAWNKMTEILETIKSFQVVVISGETGCGKSTQVPQFLLDDWLLESTQVDRNKMKHVEIICTQPRRLSAIGVAERIADERNEKVGNTVGYQIRLENKISNSTRLTFCTTGILLRRLHSDPLLDSVSHVIIDEVHERSEESDFLLLILKEMLKKRPELKVILMSATLNANLFSTYFPGTPVLNIAGRTFPVEQFFLEDILEKTNFIVEADSQFSRNLNKTQEKELLEELEYCDIQASSQIPANKIRDENLTLSDFFARYQTYSKRACKSLFLMEPMKINLELIESILRFIVEGEHDWPKEGSILIFLPGLAEIQSVYDSLSDNSVFSPRAGKFILVPLHSTLTNEEQSQVFRKAPIGKRKIVLSTNIAETSVTIDDCVFVIDCGQMKEKRFDSNRNMESLDLVWVSRANALQRKGRAGRVMPGISIHLYTHNRFTYQFLGQPVPEIQRIPLEQLLLRIKTLPNFENREVSEIIEHFLEPPTDHNVSSAITRLQDVGAFDSNQNLTALGFHLAELPVDVRIGKLMLFGAIFQCVDSVLTIAACLSYKSPFISPFSKRSEADAKKKQFSICNSDHLTVLAAYRKYQEACKRSKYSGKCFAEDNYLSWKTLETLVEIKNQFLELLVSIGFVPVDLTKRRGKIQKDDILEITGPELNANGDNSRLVAALLCAALYPNIVKVLTPEKSFTMSMGGAVPRLPNANELRFKTREDGYVNIHPGSVNSVVRHFSSPFLVYQEKVKTSRIFIRDCTMVPLLPIVLFSGSDINIELHGGDFIIMLEAGWILMQSDSFEVSFLVIQFRWTISSFHFFLFRLRRWLGGYVKS